MTLKISTIEQWLPPIAALWFFVVINSFIIWNPLAPVLHAFPAVLIVWGTFLISYRLSPPRYNRFLFLFIFIYFIWILISQCDGFGEFVKRSSDFIPLLCISLWPSDILLKTYKIIRGVFIFYAVGSSIISVLILLGLNNRIPHLVLPARETLHQRIGIVYYLYGVFIALCHPLTGVGSRACGMLQEPGHFAILLGFIYLIDRFSGRKINKWIVICGLLTFSSTFVLIVIFTEIHHLFSWEKLRKVVISLPFIIVALFVLYSFLPPDIKEQVEFYAYGRNLEQVVDAYNESSSLTGALDERANDFSIANYEKMTPTQYMFGGGYRDLGYALSDYRGMILDMGVLGMCLAIIAYISIMINTPIKIKIALSFAFFLIIIHRSWMLYQPYIFFQAYIAVIAYRKAVNNNNISLKTNEEQAKNSILQ